LEVNAPYGSIQVVRHTPLLCNLARLEDFTVDIDVSNNKLATENVPGHIFVKVFENITRNELASMQGPIGELTRTSIIKYRWKLGCLMELTPRYSAV
jgi:hypothetical protein